MLIIRYLPERQLTVMTYQRLISKKHETAIHFREPRRLQKDVTDEVMLSSSQVRECLAQTDESREQGRIPK